MHTDTAYLYASMCIYLYTQMFACAKGPGVVEVLLSNFSKHLPTFQLSNFLKQPRSQTCIPCFTFFHKAASSMFGDFCHIFSYNAGSPRGLRKTPPPLLLLASPQIERLFSLATLGRFMFNGPFVCMAHLEYLALVSRRCASRVVFTSELATSDSHRHHKYGPCGNLSLSSAFSLLSF